MLNGIQFPTALHADVAAAVVQFFAGKPVASVLLVNSCARGTSTSESDLDFAVLVDPALMAAESNRLQSEWCRHYERTRLFREFESIGQFTRVHLDLFDGVWEPPIWDDGGGPDGFEVEIGNRVAHAVPLLESDNAFAHLKAKWLPFYDEELRTVRLGMVVDACRRDLDRVRAGASRGLYFHSFDRLYCALQEFLQALFIAHRTYPIAYNKWIHEQVAGWLGLPDLYVSLPRVLCISGLESGALRGRADELEDLLSRWVTAHDRTASPHHRLYPDEEDTVTTSEHGV